MKQEDIVRVDLFAIYSPPSAEHLLGTDYGGRDIFGQLIIGTRNSFTIGLALLLPSTCFIGITIGLIAGYFGGKIDNIIMRFIDFHYCFAILNDCNCISSHLFQISIVLHLF